MQKDFEEMYHSKWIENYLYLQSNIFSQSIEYISWKWR